MAHQNPWRKRERERDPRPPEGAQRRSAAPGSRYVSYGAGLRGEPLGYDADYWPENETAPRGGSFRGRGPRNYIRSDERIREDVYDRLTDDPYLDAADIEIAVKDGEVTLSGFVHRRIDKRRAEDVSGAISGVRHVQNNLRVRGPRGNTAL